MNFFQYSHSNINIGKSKPVSWSY